MATVKCPTCGTSVPWTAASAFRPFCSDRCKNVDLGAWASERYAIPEDPMASGVPDERDAGES